VTGRPRGAYGEILTVPNLVSFVRLLGVPLFLYLLLGPQADVAAIVVLSIGGTSDWVDGFLARRLGQVSRLGELLDPLADRLYIFATLIALTVRDVLPWWFTIALVAREAFMGGLLLLLRRRGYGPPAVHYVGKSATFILLVAFPVLLLAHVLGQPYGWWYAAGWGLALWGLALYWIAAIFYVIQVYGALRESREPA
jgi:cardiolipin synthase (CMP-forming)